MFKIRIDIADVHASEGRIRLFVATAACAGVKVV
jgi:hypothetical protein